MESQYNAASLLPPAPSGLVRNRQNGLLGYTDLHLAEVMEFEQNFSVIVAEGYTGIGATELLVDRSSSGVGSSAVNWVSGSIGSWVVCKPGLSATVSSARWTDRMILLRDTR